MKVVAKPPFLPVKDQSEKNTLNMLRIVPARKQKSTFIYKLKTLFQISFSHAEVAASHKVFAPCDSFQIIFLDKKRKKSVAPVSFVFHMNFFFSFSGLDFN